MVSQFLSEKIAQKAWSQVRKMVLTDNKQIKQLVSLKPIEIYDTDSSLEIDGARLDFTIKTYLENLISKRFNSSKKWFNLGSFGTQESMKYNFNVVIDGKMDYLNAAIYINHHFSGEVFDFDHGRYRLKAGQIDVKEHDGKLEFRSSLKGWVKLGPFRVATRGELEAVVNPYYDSREKKIKVKDLDYRLRTRNLILKFLNRIYEKKFESFLEGIIEIPIEEYLFTARVRAQEEINKLQKDPKYIFNGVLNDLALERIEVRPENINAVFLANGNLVLTR